ncbi:CRISPR-associated endonuclease Cas3'' [Fusobacterium necrophorum]|uniref:CRISPR-associated endonuclease Cas3'' n=1 Tax=Fusobacterium necrophorum TaxID=859 RepID=UPI00370F649C
MRGSNIKEIFQAEEIEKYYAHLKENQLGEITYETLLEHTNLSMIYFQKIVDYKDLMPIFEKICEKLKIVGKEKSLFYDMIYDTIQFHDFGKINERFQKDKMKNKQNIIELGIDYVISTQHSLLSSAIFICYYWNIINEIMEKVSEKQIIIFLEILMNLAYVISKHHGDLEDFSSFLSNGTLIKLLEYFDMVDDSKAITKIIKIPRENTPSNILNREFYPKWRQEIAIDEEKDISMVLYIFTRLMYSLLISSDYYATTEFMSEKVYEEFGNFGDISILKEDYEKNDLILNIRKKQKEGISLKDISDINDYRSKIFIESENELKNNLNSNLFFLEAPTGSGKTNTAMNLSFQLLEENRSKIFYIYPFNTLVECGHLRTHMYSVVSVLCSC